MRSKWVPTMRTGEWGARAWQGRREGGEGLLAEPIHDMTDKEGGGRGGEGGGGDWRGEDEETGDGERKGGGLQSG